MQIWIVMAMDPRRRVWTLRSKHNDKETAQQHAEALQHKHPTLRVRVKPGTARKLKIKPPVHNAARVHREEASGRMIERADANKRYKSPG